MVIETEVASGDGRTLHVYDTGFSKPDVSRVVIWHHGTPQVGEPPEPLFAAGEVHGVRWISYDRPGYGGSSPHPGRDMASAADDVRAISDALGLDRFAVMGASGGGPDFDPEIFTATDHAALAGSWGWLGKMAQLGTADGVEGLVEDDLAYVNPWGFDPAGIQAPILLLHGDSDRVVPSSHGRWLAENCQSAQLTVSPGDGHISVLRYLPTALDWLESQSGR